MPVYLTLQPIRCAARAIADAPGELLPHLFTLTAIRQDRGGSSLSRCSTVADSSQLKSVVLYVARTFLRRHRVTDALPATSRTSVGYEYKGSNFFVQLQTFN